MILNRQRKIALGEKSLATFLVRILKELKLGGMEVSVAFVTDAEIAKWNRKYRHKSGPTDVLSFPALNRWRLAHFKSKAARRKAAKGEEKKEAKKNAENAALYLGDIAIAPETARRYAEKNGKPLANARSLENELRVLMLHGVLHLLGFDHETDHGQMNRLEQELRRRLAIA